jgi:hypothetical protein
VQLAHLILLQDQGECKVLVINIVPLFTKQKDMHMQNNPCAQAPNKVGSFLPRLKDGGILSQHGDMTKGIKKN